MKCVMNERSIMNIGAKYEWMERMNRAKELKWSKICSLITGNVSEMKGLKQTGRKN